MVLIGRFGFSWCYVFALGFGRVCGSPMSGATLPSPASRKPGALFFIIFDFEA